MRTLQPPHPVPAREAAPMQATPVLPAAVESAMAPTAYSAISTRLSASVGIGALSPDHGQGGRALALEWQQLFDEAGTDRPSQPARSARVVQTWASASTRADTRTVVVFNSGIMFIGSISSSVSRLAPWSPAK
ncbi:hypothetical protein RCH23_000502 [Cryobacterium sp. CAN_C3]|nr:hypothetical protein [Cryobacterium sp. CAN_C3]